MSRSLKVASLVLALMSTFSARTLAGEYTVYVTAPSGGDDTTAIQHALDACVAHGPGCTVQLVAGTYHTRQLVTYNFHGTFRGISTDLSTIEALPYLPVTMTFADLTKVCLPNTTTCLWPTFIIFVDGDISISDLSIHMTATDGTATDPWAGGATNIETAIRLMGQYPMNVHIDRVEMEGRPDSASGFGFNVGNGIMYTGELNSSPAPLSAPCGAPGGFYFLSGSYTVRNSSFKMMSDGVSQDGCVRSAQVTIGGSPSTGNTFENHNTGIDLESAENSNFEISYNVSSGIGVSMWVVPWISTIFVPNAPSRYLIHDNTFFTTGAYGTGIFLYNDTPDHPWINAVIWNNTIQLQDILSDGIDAVNTKGTTILNDTITGGGYDAVGLWSSTSSTVINNNVSGYTPDASVGLAQIYLDPATSQDFVVCSAPNDSVLNQGSDNLVVGCQQPAAAPKTATMSGNPAPQPRFQKAKPLPYRR